MIVTVVATIARGRGNHRRLATALGLAAPLTPQVAAPLRRDAEGLDQSGAFGRLTWADLAPSSGCDAARAQRHDRSGVARDAREHVVLAERREPCPEQRPGDSEGVAKLV